MRQQTIIGFALLAMLGCDGDRAPGKTVFDSQVQALKKARDVDQKIQDAAQRQRDQVERQESGEK